MQISRVCCPGSQIVSQSKTIWAPRRKETACPEQIHRKHEVKHREVPVHPRMEETKIKPYLSIDLQESLGVTGNTLLIWTPSSYCITSSVVHARCDGELFADLTTKESGNRFHISNLFCHYSWGWWTDSCQNEKKGRLGEKKKDEPPENRRQWFNVH